MAEPGSGNVTRLGRIVAIGVRAVVFLLFGELAVRLMGYPAIYDTYSADRNSKRALQGREVGILSIQSVGEPSG